MTRTYDRVELSEGVVADAVRWYASHTEPAAFREVHPQVLARVKKITGGGLRRCVVEEDGSVTIYNRPRW